MRPARGLFLCFIIFLHAVLQASPVQATGQPTVTAARAGDHDGVTRFVIDISDRVPFSLQAQVQPAQVTVTLPELDWRADNGGMSRPVGLLNNFAYSTPRPGAGRLVLETGRPVKVQKAFIIPPVDYGSYRLVVDLAEAAARPSPGQPTALPIGGALAGGALAVNPILAPSGPNKIVPPTEPVPVALPTPPPSPVTVAPPDHRNDRRGKPLVVIDPGHGGVDPGAISVTGAFEKNIVLALAHEVKADLETSGKVRCQLTRDHDVFIALRDRVAVARAAHAELFISLHADSVADPDIRGLSVYTLSQTASDTEAQALADKENKADIVAGVDLSNESPEVTNILIDLVQRESMNLSAIFAGYVIQDVSQETQLLPQNTHRFAGFAVLKAPDIPSVLIETGYLSNERDEQLLRRPAYRAKLAAALARAIEHYFVRAQKPGGK
jgi:N-acetylmuramoyl-L-alanine amidase